MTEQTETNDGAAERPWAITVLQQVGLGVVVLGLVWVVFNVELPPIGELQQRIVAFGWGAWIVFILLYALVATTPIPVTIMAVTAGLLFDIVSGTVLSVVGVMLGCWIAYWVARGLGKQTMLKLLGRHGPTVQEHLRESGFYAVAALRLMPGMPYWPVNYGAGAFGVKHTPYLTASILSCIPGQFSLVAVGAFIADPSVLTGAAVVIGWSAVGVLTVLSYRRWKHDRPEPSGP